MKNRMMFVARVRSQLVNSRCCSQGIFRARTSELTQRLHRLKSINLRCGGFTLAEVVLALGVIAIAVTMILALFPVALTTGHSAQDATRGPHIAQGIITAIASEAQATLGASPTPIPAIISQPSPSPSFSYSVDLTATSTPSPSATPNFYADNDGNLTQNAATAAYAIYIFTNNSPPGFPPPPPVYANQVTVRVAAPANAPSANQTFRDYVRIISKY
jgi:type II secretory pathway pseudopilin PulG